MGTTHSQTCKMLQLLSLAGLMAALSQGIPMQSPECCDSKDVGGVSYSLVGQMDTKAYQCLNNCIYVKDQDPTVKFCFASGDLQVECTEDEFQGFDKPPMGGSDKPPMEGTDKPPMEGSDKPPTEAPADLCPDERPGFGSACRLPEMTCDYGKQTCCGESIAEYQMECRAGEWNGYYIDTVCMDAAHVCANTTTEPSCICPAVFSPVCGADGQTYSSACKASCGGNKVACEGECPCTSCSCIEIFAPVCGADGETHSNSCKAACAGSEVTCQGECPCQ